MTRGALACALMLGATFAGAAGLGKLTVNSALGQILNAEIDLVSLQPGELDAMSARVSPPEAYRDARIEYSGSLRLLRFSIDKRANGQPIIKITSVAPINEPFVDMLIEVSWPAGRIQREYPILLDPPGYSTRGAPPTVAAAPAAPSRPADAPPASAPAASSSAPASPASDAGSPSARTELATTPPGTPRESGKSAAGSQAGSDTYGPVEKGDTLNKIASQVKPQNVSLEQMLVALYRENQAAFVNNNMNRLKTGQILKVPTAEDVEKITSKEANTEYRTHVADWNSYREQVAGGVAAIPARSESGTTTSGRVASAAVTPPAPPAADSKDVLKLSKSDAAAGKAGAGAKGGGGSASQDRVNALQEELTAKDKALRESQSRVSDLEKQIRDMQRLMDLKAGAPAKADTKTAAAPAKVEPPKAEPPKVAAVEPAKPVEAPKVDASKGTEPKFEPPKAEPPKTEAPKAEPPKVAEAPKPAPPKADSKPAPKKAAPPPEKGFMDELMDNPAILMGGVGVLAALGIGGFLFMRRRKNGAEAAPDSSLTSAFPSDLKPGSTTGKPAGGLVDTGNSSFLTDFDKTGPGTIDTDEVDPVAEAEVYIAYGRDAQAEEILKEAMARDKGRHEIALKLLEIYHARKSATAFETVAKELRGSVGEDSPAWQKAAAMGAQIDPTNPLYAAGAGAAGSYTPSAASMAKPDVDFGIDSTSTSQPAPDFDLELDPTKSRSSLETTNTPSSNGLDFDLAPSAPAPAPVVEAPREEKPSFDFDLSGLDMGGSKPASDSGDSGSSPLADLSLDMPDSGGGTEAVGTKLELAKAYLEIGDKDGAREILKEVAKEGSADQRAEAERLIASL